ncbi:MULTISPECIES: GntR family transcriptional regulator [unclassified Curtobacterium]|uniref:GntR family transcriptional regulator n=1 Tax=unclassified Curtobacterium TaxID=257496 RepID=UPI000DA73D28|nr:MULTISPECIES: GntR family transcriptional regulator [unclassified Curtobacterium]MDY1003326.1 GntR family transcriptional regulator [Curtobacterium sp. CFBP9011]WIE62376.1 GntR family transcriptional regulator [Curtobacterium sp. MCLR17_032]
MTNDGQLPSDLFMDLDRSGPMPLYHQVASRIEESIRNGAMPPGARLENEIALGERLGLSRPTIRRAIQDLVDKGLLVRRRGIGTQVVHGPVTRKVELTSLYDDLTQGSQQPTTKLLDRSDVPATQAVAEALGVEVGTTVVHVLRVRFAEDVPMAVLENYLPPEFADITDEDLRAHGLYQLLRSRGVTMRVAKQRIGARAATDDEAGLLEIEDGDPVLTMSRTAYDASGRAVEYGLHCYRPDRYSFEVTLVDK